MIRQGNRIIKGLTRDRREADNPISWGNNTANLATYPAHNHLEPAQRGEEQKNKKFFLLKDSLAAWQCAFARNSFLFLL